MIKILFKILIISFFLIVSFVGYFSLIGFETKSFNKQIKENLKNIDTKFDVKLNDVKIILDLFNLNINAKTLGPIISYDNKPIDIELIKSDISLMNLLNKEFSLSNLFISTKSVKLKDFVAFYRAINNKKKTELFILENFIGKGYLIADININFDEKGKVKDDLEVNGLVRDSSLKLLNDRKIDNINFIFEIQNKDLDINDLNFTYEKLNFISKKIELRIKDNFVNVEGEINNNEVNLSEELLNNFFNPSFNLNLKNLRFSSNNKFLFKISDKFKILDYKIKSSLNINELSVRNNIDLKNIFPNFSSETKFNNHQIEMIVKKDYFLIDGNGEFLIQKNYDKAS